LPVRFPKNISYEIYVLLEEQASMLKRLNHFRHLIYLSLIPLNTRKVDQYLIKATSRGSKASNSKTLITRPRKIRLFLQQT